MDEIWKDLLIFISAENEVDEIMYLPDFTLGSMTISCLENESIFC